MIDGQNFFDRLVKNDLRTYDNIQRITIGQEDDCTTGCLLDYIYSKKYYKMIAIDLTKQQALYTDPKEIQQINFTGNIIRKNNGSGNINVYTIFFIIEEAKETDLDFLQETVRVL